MNLWLELSIMLVIILISAQLFSNALEYFGEKLGISTGVTGSILAAISTALPETIIPILAMISGTSDRLVNEEISVGAILGAPLMLSTLSTFIMAVSVIRKRSIFGKISPEKSGFIRDLNFFITAICIAAIAMFAPHQPIYLRASFSVILIALYIAYLVVTVRASNDLVKKGHGVYPTEPLFFSKMGFKSNLKTILIQLIVGLVLLIFGAKGFINNIQEASISLGISTLLLSLLIIPIATELPEKVNSVLWVRKNKDTLAFGNITGAMVFQGTLLPALGILLTPWNPGQTVLTGIIVTGFAAAWLRYKASKDGIGIISLFVNGMLYLLYLALVFSY